MENEIRKEWATLHTRRWFLQSCGVGMAGLALNSFFSQANAKDRDGNPLAARAPHFAPTAKRVIYIFQAGAPSHLDLFDHKPELVKRDGELPPPSLLKDYRAAFIDPNSAFLGTKYAFDRYGESGMEISTLLPHLSKHVDDLCLIKSMQTDAVNHAPAQIFLSTGSSQFGRPSFGSWTLYGLGSETEELPGYVVLTSAKGTSGGASNYGCGFLPTVYSGVPFRGSGDPILYLSNPDGYDRQAQRASLDTLKRLNQQTLDELADPETASRIQAYETAYQLQASAPELMNLKQESQTTLDAYGINNPKESNFARNCLLGRRLLERGVRFVQLFHEAWDQHGGLDAGLRKNCEDTDRPFAALLQDLKDRDMLKDTLVVWGGEFGRTPMAQGKERDGRDHHNKAFTMVLAGGGIKEGYVHGATDDFGFDVIENPVHVHDLNATLLHTLGFDHERLTYRFQGRDYRLTDVHGHVVQDILA
ncbi:MAG: DUF1501 domain-containing protein [Verrucomicrobiae bacterium]|nr:DUF1501 domain-containing protein [Verrucomicrobiae bacterium]